MTIKAIKCLISNMFLLFCLDVIQQIGGGALLACDLVCRTKDFLEQIFVSKRGPELYAHGTHRECRVRRTVRGVTTKTLSAALSIRRFRKRRENVTTSIGGVHTKLDRTVRRQVQGRQVGTSLVAGISRSVGAPLASVIGCISLLGHRGLRGRGTHGCVQILSRGSRQLGRLARSLIRTSGVDSKGVRLSVRAVSLMRLLCRANNRFGRHFRTQKLAVIAGLPRGSIVVQTSKQRLCHTVRGLCAGTTGCTLRGAQICMSLRMRRGGTIFHVGGVSGGPLPRRKTTEGSLARHFIEKRRSHAARKDNLKLSVTGGLARLVNNRFTVLMSNSLFTTSVAFTIITWGCVLLCGCRWP